MEADDIWNDFFGSDFESLNKRIERMFSNIDEMNDDGFRTYGYTMYKGPDGIPHVQEFGNSSVDNGIITHSIEGSREPLTDVTLENGLVRAIVELPGVSKEDIVLESTKNSLSISVDTPSKKFQKTLALPCDVDPDSANAEYNNGMLEVTVKSVNVYEDKKRISIH